MRALAALVVLALPALAGCLAPAAPGPQPAALEPPPASEAPADPGPPRAEASPPSPPPAAPAPAPPAPSPPAPLHAPPTVIAVLDSGINPYHLAFRGGPSFADVPGFAALARAVPLSLGAASYEAAVEADSAAWKGVQGGELVWFPGTRLAAVSLGRPTNNSDGSPVATGPHAVLDDQGHGTLVSDAALEAGPHAVVVMVQVSDDEQLAEGMRWVASQPWIDLVSVSWATWSYEYTQGEHRMGLPEAYAEAWRAGKLIFNGAGNEPIPHFVGEHSGPSFVVAVGGAQNATRGDSRIASRFPDVVGPFVHPARAVRASRDAREEAAGTSLATPWVAGVAAEALWAAREALGARRTGTSASGALVEAPGGGALADGALTAQELRAAMNLRATLWGAADWRAPAVDPAEPADFELLFSQPVVHPASQMGWGYVEPAQAADIAAYLLGALALPAKPDDVVAFMEARQAARERLWGA